MFGKMICFQMVFDLVPLTAHRQKTKIIWKQIFVNEEKRNETNIYS
jgi:hypothetical protein